MDGWIGVGSLFGGILVYRAGTFMRVARRAGAAGCPYARVSKSRRLVRAWPPPAFAGNAGRTDRRTERGSESPPQLGDGWILVSG